MTVFRGAAITKVMASTYQKISMPRRQEWEGQKKKRKKGYCGAMDGFWKLKTMEVSL